MSENTGQTPSQNDPVPRPVHDPDAAAPAPYQEGESRPLRVAAGQLGPINRNDSRSSVVDRLVALIEEASGENVDLVAFPELALTTFFPRWYLEWDEADKFYETSMPGLETQRLFDVAKHHGIGFSLGYAELTPDGHHRNTQILVERDGTIVGYYNKVHVPGHREYEPWREFQHLERRYFEQGDSFPTFDAFGGTLGMATCNDRRWPETYRCLGLGGVELILIGYNTPLHYAPDPTQDALAGFHNRIVMQTGAYQNGTFVIGAAKGGMEEGVDSLAESSIFAPSGERLAVAETNGDELVIADIDLAMCARYKQTLFQFDRYYRPEVYTAITDWGEDHPRADVPYETRN